MKRSEEMREKLSEIWDAWGLVGADETTSKAQQAAVDVVAKWLEAGKEDPEIAIRAVQLLLADPEQPGLRKRECWRKLRKELHEVWSSAGTGKDHFLYVQALLLAAWPTNEEEGLLSMSHLLDSAWDIRRGQPQKEFADWRARSISSWSSDEDAEDKPRKVSDTKPKVTQFEFKMPDTTAQLLKHVDDYKGQNNYSTNGTQIAELLKTTTRAIDKLLDGLSTSTRELSNVADAVADTIKHVNAVIDTLDEHVDNKLDDHRSKLDLLWWGQSRYCRALRKPYLRMKSAPSALLWWTAREAAELSLSVDVEPAAAYLVETLHHLNQDIDEQKPVHTWMAELYAALQKDASITPRLSKRLDALAGADSLALPVTWVRRKVMHKDAFDEQAAKEDVALLLDETIDRGQWASWIFRETLLDLHLADDR